MTQASFTPSESGEVGAYGSTPGPSGAVAGAGGVDAVKEEDVVSGDYPKILLMGMRRSGKSSITKVFIERGSTCSNQPWAR